MRKTFIYLALVVFIALTAACSSFNNRGTVERPFIESSNQEALSIEKVVLSDSSTVLYGVIHFRPGWWVSLAKTSYITANGEKYAMLDIDGIATDEQVTMPDSGVIHFTMTYPAIPADTRSIDYAEGTDTGWQIWGIDLTVKADHNINLDKVPAGIRNDTVRTLPDPVIAFDDSTTVRVHILGYRPGMGKKLLWAANTLHGQIGVDTPADIDPEGNATIKLAISAPTEFFIIGFSDGNYISGNAILSPGETMDLYVDSHLTGIRNMMIRDGIERQLPQGYHPSFADGRYPDINQNTGRGYYGMQFYSGQFGDYHMNGDEYTAYIIDSYKALNDSIDAAKDMTEMGRKYTKTLLEADLINAAVNAKKILERNYYVSTGKPWGSEIHPDTIPVKLSNDNVKEIAGYIDFNDANLLMSDNINQISNISLWEDAGIDAGILKAVNLYNKAYKAADNAKLDSATVDSLRKMYPAMADEIEAHYKASKERLEAIDASYLTTTPDVAPTKVFDAIVAPLKGKVVVVDLWNTWCAPCRAAIAENEPEKSGDLSSEDIAWVYIANETSPEPKYMSMIKDIKGTHYRLNPEQWEAICNRFDVDGIPFYIIVDRTGKATPRPDLRDHSLFKKTILEKLAQ